MSSFNCLPLKSCQVISALERGQSYLEHLPNSTGRRREERGDREGGYREEREGEASLVCHDQLAELFRQLSESDKFYATSDMLRLQEVHPPPRCFILVSLCRLPRQAPPGRRHPDLRPDAPGRKF
eukprot:499458-Hanusia_phi.AAC.1